MQRIEIPTKDVAAIAKILGYRRRTAVIYCTEKTRLTDLNWSGGSRSTYTAIRLSDGAASGISDAAHMAPPWANPFEGQEIQIPAGVVIAETGYFQGKVSTLQLYVRPDNMSALLPRE